MTEIHLHKLKEPFAPDRISWRIGATNKEKTKGIALAYIDARDVMQRLDEVCGPENWQCRYPHAGSKTVCDIGIRLMSTIQAGSEIHHTYEWIWKSNGAGDTDVEGEKGAMSDAFKRAAVLWGIGQYLYDLNSPWVALEGKKIAKHEYARLHKLVGGKTSNQLNQTTAWDDFQNDLANCDSVYKIEKLYTELRNEGWSKEYLAKAAEECTEHKKEILNWLDPDPIDGMMVG